MTRWELIDEISARIRDLRDEYEIGIVVVDRGGQSACRLIVHDDDGIGPMMEAFAATSSGGDFHSPNSPEALRNRFVLLDSDG